MKKIVRKVSFASLMLMATAMPALAAGVPAGVSDNGLCELMNKMMDVFKILRTLAFIGAAFYIAGWAWGYISKGDAQLDDVKKKGIGLLVGFTLLFAIGIVLSFLMSQGGQAWIGCKGALSNWGN